MSCAILRGHSCEIDAQRAVAELSAQILQPQTALVVFFCSCHYDRSALAEALRAAFAGITVVGCTTAGEIGPAGYRDASLVGVAFPAGGFTAECGPLCDLEHFDAAAAHVLAQTLLQRLEARVLLPSVSGLVALQLIDGLSAREEVVSNALQRALGDVPLIGGSAGDNLQFHQTFVYFDGAFVTNAAVLVLLHTTLPFATFKIDHYQAIGERMVVTDADPSRRLVRELNGVPACEEYARVVGDEGMDLEPRAIAATPVVVQIDGVPYVRAVMRASAEGLIFACAIEEGIILRLARGGDPLRSLEEALVAIEARIGPPQLILGCDCIFRRLDIARQGRTAVVEALLRRVPILAFSTYGEQFAGLHINQTFVGVAFGTEPRSGEVNHA